MELVDSVRLILKQKSGTLWSIAPEAWVYDAIEIMAEKDIGALLVLDKGKLVGLFSERDYARKCILHDKTSKQTHVSEIMSTPAIFVTPETTVEECMRIMTTERIRHLPVVENDQVLGVASIGDLVKWIISAHKQTIEQLHGYITGQYPG